ncbi:ParM/StbA family protein [Paenibacillus tyrfis]|uniref:ParM/StbA family protein n=1 Tax=Paenibacillus tyrfis TaxID=1501230 RepID=UPI00209D43E6|nr:ParM/StbA family protein [Paenibacillus tyrfis]MCP1312098.1 ParM/StbA family protein [Paenibacillus tyrfis]
MRISVDIGFGYTKAVSEAGQEVTFPSIVGRKFASSLEGILGGNQEDYIVTLSYPDKPEEDAQSYYVGDAAMTAGGNRTWEEEHAKNRNLEVLISTAVGLLNEKDEEPIQLAVGLPMTVFKAQQKEIQRKLTGLHITCVIGKKTKELQVDTVFVFPQGAGVYYAALHDINGEIKNVDLLNKQVAVIDVGYRTTDFLFMVRGKKGLVARPEPFSGSEDIGMNTAHMEIQTEILKPLRGQQVDLLDIEKALLWHNGMLSVKGGELDLKPYRARAYANVSNEITSRLKRRWGDDINTLASIISGGGGGDALHSHFENSFPVLTKIEKPEYANARGYLAAQALVMKGRG